MRELVVVFENSKRKEVVKVPVAKCGDVEQAVGFMALKWLHSLIRSSDESGACLCFSVSVHSAGPECDHEQPGVPHANTG
jgi:hypothetical protein